MKTNILDTLNNSDDHELKDIIAAIRKITQIRGSTEYVFKVEKGILPSKSLEPLLRKRLSSFLPLIEDLQSLKEPTKKKYVASVIKFERWQDGQKITRNLRDSQVIVDQYLTSLNTANALSANHVSALTLKLNQFEKREIDFAQWHVRSTDRVNPPHIPFTPLDYDQLRAEALDKNDIIFMLALQGLFNREATVESLFHLKCKGSHRFFEMDKSLYKQHLRKYLDEKSHVCPQERIFNQFSNPDSFARFINERMNKYSKREELMSIKDLIKYREKIVEEENRVIEEKSPIIEKNQFE